MKHGSYDNDTTLIYFKSAIVKDTISTWIILILYQLEVACRKLQFYCTFLIFFFHCNSVPLKLAFFDINNIPGRIFLFDYILKMLYEPCL